MDESDNNLLGTPQTLDDLTQLIMLCPMMYFRERVPLMIKDYLANKIAPDVITAKDTELEKKLMDVFYRMTERKQL